MPQPEEIPKWDLVVPSEENGYGIFRQDLEANPLVLFHSTPKSNFSSIVSMGFRSAASLEIGALSSVSYAKRSSGCLAHVGNKAIEDLVVFAVKFETLDQEGIAENLSDIHVYKKDIQPAILGYCEVLKGYCIS